MVDIQSRYDHLEQFRRLQLGTDSRVAELSSQANLQALEGERALLVQGDSQGSGPVSDGV